MAYVGTRLFNRRHTCRYFKIVKNRPVAVGYLDEGKINVGTNPPGDWIVMENVHEPLVERELFDEVQVAMERRRRSWLGTPRSKKKQYLLSVMLMCKRCGSPLTGHTKTASKAKGSKVYLTYACSGAKKHGKSVCANCSFPAERMEGFVLSRIRGLLSSAAAMASIERGMEAQLAQARGSLEAVEKAEARVAELEKKKERLFQKLDLEKLELFQGPINALLVEQRQLQRLVVEAKSQANSLPPKEVVRQALKTYKEFTATLQGPCRSSMREVLRALGVRLVYDPEKKEGFLTFDPFGQSASRKAQPPTAA